MSSKSKKTVHADSVLNRSVTINSSTWPEWSDIELNAEPWDYPKGGEFIDPQQVVMPRSLQPIEWKRFGQLDYIGSPIVYETISSYPDLITNNQHLMHSEFIRCFVSTLINLQYCGRKGLEIENPTSNFTWNLGDQCWQGWFNVYSLNKAGNGVPHNPVYNPNGRYVVRIFHMGRWRRILIDDSVPIDKRGRPLLPRTSNGNELWPLILAKAMLKIASLSWTTKREIADCSLITCLTGWTGLSLNVSHISPCDQWQFIIKYVKHFEWPANDEPSTDQVRSDLTEKSTKSRKSKIKATKIEDPEDPRPVLLFLSLEDTINVSDDGIPGITPCWNHQICVHQSRDVPLDPSQVRVLRYTRQILVVYFVEALRSAWISKVKPELAKWKNHRWLDWAIRRGYADASEYFVPVRRLLVTSPLRRCTAGNYDEAEDLEDEDSPRTTIVSRDEKTGQADTPNNAGSSKEKIRDTEISDSCLWADFNKLSNYLREVHLFYRQKFFKHSIEMSDNVEIQLGNDGKTMRTDSSSRDVKKIAARTNGPPPPPPAASADGEKLNQYQEKIWQSSNEPRYLFVDSIDDKFFLINLSTATRDNRTHAISVKSSSSLIIERHSFMKRFTEPGTIGVIKTRGTKSLVFQLEPGRHLLRIFINYETTFRAIVCSDTIFEIGDRSKIQRLMTNEAHRIDKISRDIWDSTRRALESFGTASYSKELKNYYRSYMPDSSVTFDNEIRRTIRSIHRWFIDDFFKLIEMRLSTNDLPIVRRALRIFFLDPTIGTRFNDLSYKREDESRENHENEAHGQATMIQSFFRMSLIKRYREIHATSHAQHFHVKDALSRVIEIFEKNDASSLLRKIIVRDKSLARLYGWANDLGHVLEIREIDGRVASVTIDRWMPILRILVNTKITEVVAARIDLFVNFSNFSLRVFDNNANLEVSRLVNCVNPADYHYRENGYTIFAYGGSDSPKYSEHEWTLHLTTIKGEPTFHWINERPMTFEKINTRPLVVQELSGNYLPNVKNCIFKLIGKIRKRIAVSLRFVTSYEKVNARLLVTKENGDIVAELEGHGTTILPIVFLEFDATNETEMNSSSEKLLELRKSSNRKSAGSTSHRSANLSSRQSSMEHQIFHNFTRYSIVAYVQQDSWPLTEAEWSLVMELRANDRAEIGKKRKSSSTTSGVKSERSKILKKSLENVEPAKPFWTLQIVTDATDELEIIRDTSRDDRIDELRKIWQIDESGRSERGRKLRQRFLDENSIIDEHSGFDAANETTSNSQREIEGKKMIADSSNNEISRLNERTLRPPENLANFLPKLDLTIYMERDDEEEERWVKSDYDEETLRNQRAINLIDFEETRKSLLNEFRTLLDKRREKYRLTTRRYLENRDERKRDMSEAYEMRRACVESTKDTARSAKSKDSIKPKKGR